MRRTRNHADLEAALADPGFTPGAHDVGPLVALVVGDEPIGDAAARALPRAGASAVQAALACVTDATPRGRVRLARMAAQAAAPATPETAEVRAWMVERLGDADAQVRRAAAAELGKPALAAPELAAPLEAALASEADAATRRTLMAALGKIGGARAADALRATPAVSAVGRADARDRGRKTNDDAGEPHPVDASTERVRARAALMAARPDAREAGVRIELDRAPPRPTAVVLHCRNGLEPLLLDELPRALGAAPARDGFGRGGRVSATLREAPATLLRSRISLGFGFPLPVVAADAHGGVPSAVAAALGSERAAEVLATCTRGRGDVATSAALPTGVRYRIRWARAGKRRAQVWDTALAIQAARPELVNDPSDSDWEVVVHELSGRVLVELVPRFDDPRFAYRLGDVPAASHPTVAAALVRASGPRTDDVVWDPFVGSGLELCERAQAGPYQQLFGSDLSDDALETARRNLASAGADRFQLLAGDARSLHPPARPTVIVTNPPMGRRVHREGTLDALLAAFVRHAAACLVPGGRLVWVSPLGARSARVAEGAGLRLAVRHAIDMGGFVADLEVWDKR